MIIYDLKNEEYHAHEAVGHTMLSNMLTSPLVFKYAKENPQEPTSAMQFGTAFHTALLEPERFAEEYITLDVDRRTKTGKEAWENALNCGKKILTAAENEKLQGMLSNVSKCETVKNLLNCPHEVSFFWQDKQTGIECKSRADALKALNGRYIIVDIKTTVDCSAEAFARACINYHYDMQAAMYIDGISKELDKPCTFVFVCVEKEPPYDFNIFTASSAMLNKGNDDMRYCLGLLKNCTETGNFYGKNGADGNIAELDLPAWLQNTYEEPNG